MADIALTSQQVERATLARRVRLISWLSLGWMTVEGAIGLTAGILANSIALIGYGLDSSIEGVASLIIIWRFTGDRIHSDDAERRAQKVVGATFFLLAPYILVSATQRLAAGSHADASWVGIGLAVVSITLMPIFGRVKRRIGNQLQSHATAGEGTQNILCAYLSLAILIGLGANALLGLWWADPAVALVVALLAIQAGLRTWRGQACDPSAESPTAPRWRLAVSPRPRLPWRLSQSASKFKALTELTDAEEATIIELVKKAAES